MTRSTHERPDDPLAAPFPRTDPTGEVDMEQLEYNLSLTPDQRMRQYMEWLEFIEVVRQAGREHYGMESRAAPAVE